MNYTYEIKKLSPKQEFMTVVYKAEGYPDYTCNYNPQQFDEEHLNLLITKGSQKVVDFWNRWSEHPDNTEVTINVSGSGFTEPSIISNVDFNHAPTIEDQPSYDPYTQKIELNQIENPMQETVGWTVIDLTPEEQAFALEAGKEKARFDRNVLLSSTDYWMFSDTPEPTQAQLNYRQALRDITLQADFPKNIVWPVKPGAE